MRLLFLLPLLIGPLRAIDPQLEGPGLAIDLISESRSITPGQPFTVGLHIHHFPGFHTDWKSPGMVGVATSIEWTLPKGFTASEMAWPYPENTFMSEYPCHGYERDVTLLVTLTPPQEISEKTVTLDAKTIWMCCAKGCFPGFQTFTMTLPVTDKPVPEATALAHSEKARSELPEKKHKVEATLLSATDAREIKIHFAGEGKLSPKKAYFFSSDGQISSDQKQTFVRQNDGSLLLTIARSEFSPEGQKTLPGVLRLGKKHLAIEARPKS